MLGKKKSFHLLFVTDAVLEWVFELISSHSVNLTRSISDESAILVEIQSQLDIRNPAAIASSFKVTTGIVK